MKKHSIKKSKKKSPKECTLMKTVIVVGAGASGIAAAGVLNKQGYKVIVLEGRDRVGGRICETKLMKNLHDNGSIRHHHQDDIS